jgi:hypothetical protein
MSEKINTVYKFFNNLEDSDLHVSEEIDNEQEINNLFS